MIAAGWREYRAWALRARKMQSLARRWYAVAFACAVLAAVLGTAAVRADEGTLAAKILGSSAGIVAAISPIIASYILQVGSEASWIRARSTAEAIKSECFRFAARVGAYAQADAASQRFRARLVAIAAEARDAGLSPLDTGAPAPADVPPEPLTVEWYLQHRVDDQTGYYAKAQRRNERGMTVLNLANLVIAALAAALGITAANTGMSSLGPWVGVLTTIGAMLIASGLLDRRKFLAASYGSTAAALRLQRTRFEEPAINLPALVGDIEDLLVAEQSTWKDRMAKVLPPPVAAKQPDAAALPKLA